MQNVTREFWVHPINTEREKKGEFYVLYPDLRHYHKRFFKTCRMSVERFNKLLELVGPRIAKKYTNFRIPISAEQRLLVTIRYVYFRKLSIKASCSKDQSYLFRKQCKIIVLCKKTNMTQVLTSFKTKYNVCTA